MSRRIGLFVNGYDDNKDVDKKLQAGVNDVSRIYSVLTSEQFGRCDRTESKMYTNIKTRKKFGDILYETLETLNPTDQFIFYFSGHGEHNNSVYHLKFESDLFSFKTFLSELESVGINKAIIILDACFSGSAVVPKNSTNHINIPPLPQGIAILTSSTENQFSYEKDNKSFSVFTDLLCECIESGNGEEPTPNDYITIEDIVTYVEKNNLHKDKQEPKYKIENAKNSIWIAENITKKGIDTQIIPTESHRGMSDIEEINYNNSCFTDKVNTRITINELNWELIQKYTESKKLNINFLLEKKSILKELNFTIQEKIINGVVLNFTNRPEKFIPQAHVVIVLDTYTNNERFYGSNIELLKQTLKFLEEKLEKFSYRDEEGVRIDGSVIPKDVLREALSNALVHRCYDKCNKPIRVTLLEELEKITIESPGNFLGNYEKLLSEEDNDYSDSRDAKMSDYLIHLGGAEGVGTGFKFFREYQKKEGKEAVSFQVDNKFTKIILKFQKRKSISLIPLIDNKTIEKVENEFIVNDADIQNKQGNYIFTIDNICSGKSTIQYLMMLRLWDREDILLKYINKNGDTRHAAILDSWIKELKKGNLPSRTMEGQIQEFSISFGQANKKVLELNFLEISGGDIKHIVPTLESKETKGLPKQLDNYLKLPTINKRFLFVSDANVHRQGSEENSESEDVLFFHLLEYLLGTKGLNIKKIEILFVVAKWDIVEKEYSSVKEYVQRHFPQTRSILTNNRCNTVYIPFSVGKIEKVEDKKTKEYERKIVSLEEKYVDSLIHWIYYTYTKNTLKNFPKIVPTFFDKIRKALKI